MTHDGWIQPTVALSGSGQLSAEVEGWISKLTPEQKDPSMTLTQVECVSTKGAVFQKIKAAAAENHLRRGFAFGMRPFKAARNAGP